MSIISSLKKGYEGHSPIPGWNNSLVPGRDRTFLGNFSIDGPFSIVYRMVDQGTGGCAAFSLLLDRDDAISLGCVLKRIIAQRDGPCETYRHGDVFLTCEASALPLISFPKRGLSIRFMNHGDYSDLQTLLADYLYDFDAECPCDHDRERD